MNKKINHSSYSPVSPNGGGRENHAPNGDKPNGGDVETSLPQIQEIIFCPVCGRELLGKTCKHCFIDWSDEL